MTGGRYGLPYNMDVQEGYWFVDDWHDRPIDAPEFLPCGGVLLGTFSNLLIAMSVRV